MPIGVLRFSRLLKTIRSLNRSGWEEWGFSASLQERALTPLGERSLCYQIRVGVQSYCGMLVPEVARVLKQPRSQTETPLFTYVRLRHVPTVIRDVILMDSGQLYIRSLLKSVVGLGKQLERVKSIVFSTILPVVDRLRREKGKWEKSCYSDPLGQSRLARAVIRWTHRNRALGWCPSHVDVRCRREYISGTNTRVDLDGCVYWEGIVPANIIIGIRVSSQTESMQAKVLGLIRKIFRKAGFSSDSLTKHVSANRARTATELTFRKLRVADRNVVRILGQVTQALEEECRLSLLQNG